MLLYLWYLANLWPLIFIIIYFSFLENFPLCHSTKIPYNQECGSDGRDICIYNIFVPFYSRENFLSAQGKFLITPPNSPLLLGCQGIYLRRFENRLTVIHFSTWPTYMVLPSQMLTLGMPLTMFDSNTETPRRGI